MTGDRGTALALVWLLTVACAGYVAIPVILNRGRR